MTKLILLLSRRPGVSVGDFHRYWREHHQPLVARLPGIRRIVLNHVVSGAGDETGGYDGIAEAWYDNPAAMRTSLASPEAAAVYADAARFIDLATFRQLVVEEQEGELLTSAPSA